MARSTAEIQADIAVTRRRIEHGLETLRRRLPDRWWVPYAALAGGLVVGVIASRVPVLKLVGTSTRVVKAGFAVASAVAAVDRFMAERPRQLEERKAA
jgi:hypothetical protein